MARRHRLERDAVDYVYERHIAGHPKRVARVEEVIADTEVAIMIYDLRTRVGLTQAALAKKVGTTASAISRLEDADYQGHSLAMLRRIAAALGRRVEIRFVPDRKKRAPQARRPAKRKPAPKSRRTAKENGARRRRAA